MARGVPSLPAHRRQKSSRPGPRALTKLAESSFCQKIYLDRMAPLISDQPIEPFGKTILILHHCNRPRGQKVCQDLPIERI